MHKYITDSINIPQSFVFHKTQNVVKVTTKILEEVFGGTLTSTYSLPRIFSLISSPQHPFAPLLTPYFPLNGFSVFLSVFSIPLNISRTALKLKRFTQICAVSLSPFTTSQFPLQDLFSQTGRDFQPPAEKSLRKTKVRSHAGRSNFGCVEFAFSKKLTYRKYVPKKGIEKFVSFSRNLNQYFSNGENPKNHYLKIYNYGY